jgi:tight adherence protein C
MFAGLGALLVLLAVPLLLRKDADPIERLNRLERSETTKTASTSKGPLRRDQEKGNFENLAPYLEPTDDGELSAGRE